MSRFETVSSVSKMFEGENFNFNKKEVYHGEGA